MLAACGSADDTDWEPACASPAPLVEARSGRVADQHIIEVREEADIDEVADRYGVAVQERLWILPGFVADVRPAAVAAIRCDARVTRVTEDRSARALADESD